VVDSATGEVGSAGATCISLDTLGQLINRLVPGKGAINAQAASSTSNLVLGKDYLQKGYSSVQVIDSLRKYDKDGNPNSRQYLVARFNSQNNPNTAGFTGSSAISYANHVVGKDYVVAGNILLGKHVLDSMVIGYNRFKTAPLSDRLMASLLSARIVGADKRCSVYNTSSLSAYVKVAGKTESSRPWNIDLQNGTGKLNHDPIDSLWNQYHQLNIRRIQAPVAVCRDDTFKALVPVAFDSVQWTFKSKTTKGHSFSITGLSPGKYELKATYNFFNKALEESFAFQVLTGGQITLPDDTSLCQEEILVIQPMVTNTRNVVWNDGWQGSARAIKVLSDSTLIATAYDANGCAGIPDTMSLQVNLPPALSGENTDSICLQPIYEITIRQAGGQGPLRYVFNDTLAGDSTYVTHGLSSHRVPYEVVDVNGCIALDTFNILIDSVELVVGMYDSTICPGDSTKITIDVHRSTLTQHSILWSNGSKDVFNQRVSTGNHWVKMTTKLGCQDSSSVVIKTFPKLRLNLGNDTILCLSDSLSIVRSDTIVWWDDKRSLRRVFEPQPGIQIISGFSRNSHGCSSNPDSLTITGKELPVADFSYKTAEDTVFFINKSLNADTYTWFFGDQSPISLEDNPVHIYGKSQNQYDVLLISENQYCPADTFKNTVELLVSVQEIKNASVNVYPNPSLHTVHIRSTFPVVNIQVYDVTGRELRHIYNMNSNTINVKHLPEGVYRIRVTTSSGVFTRSIHKI
jgi:uncharacterized Ntn-hydrolase superfamily protein